jgi:hypothetical protein
MKEIIVFEGSEIELKPEFELVHIEEKLSMDDYDFECIFYCNPKKSVKITKDQMKRSDKDGYIALIDTRLIGPGSLKCKVIAYVSDTYGGGDWLRNTVWDGEIGIYIQKVKVKDDLS